MGLHVNLQQLPVAVVFNPQNVELCSVGCDLEAERGQGNGDVGDDAVNVETHVVVVGVEVLFDGVKFDGDETVGDVSVG